MNNNISEPENINTFGTFKYAEEYAHNLYYDGRLFRMTNEFGIENVDHYLTDLFIVEDLGPADPDKVGNVGVYVGSEYEV
jgi:hypothetical protein